MFSSKGKKALENNAAPLLEAFHNTVKDYTDEFIDTDAVIMFMGWLHYSISILMQSNLLKCSELTSVLQSGALAVRAAAPNHGLGINYIEIAQNRIFDAMRAANGSPEWPFIYYRLSQENNLRVSEEAFAGALLRETLAVSRMR